MDGSWMAYPPRFPRKLIIVEGRTGCSALLCSAHPRQGGRDTITQFSGSAVGMNLVKKGRIGSPQQQLSIKRFFRGFAPGY